MSTQVLGDVELVTKQELEAALDAVVVPEDDINSKIEAAGVALEQAIATAKAEVHSEVELSNAALAQETANRTAKDTELTDMIHDEAQLRETTDDALRSRIEREEGVREAADAEITRLVSQETEARKDADANVKTEITTELTDMIHDEAQLREAADDALRSRIEHEEGVREATDTEITQLVSQETEARKEADTELRNDFKTLLKSKKSAHFEDTIFCVRLENIPLAQATVELHDATLEIGDTLATVSADYLPEIPVTFNFVAELRDQETSALKYFYIGVRLDATGNAVIINKTKLEGEYVGNVNSTTFLYITKE